MPFKVQFVTGGLGAPKVVKALNGLTQQQVYVGVPEKNGVRKKGVISNAQLAFLHTHGVRNVSMRLDMLRAQRKKGLTYTQAHALYVHAHGSPLMNIPPRPIIEPAIEAKGNREKIQEQLKLAAKAALDGKRGEMRTRLRLAGMLAQNMVRAWFTDPRNHWAPNAPSTIRRKGSDKPLIDTGQLRKSIIYVVANG